MLSFLSESGPLIHARQARARIEPGHVGLGSSPNSEPAGLVFIGHIYGGRKYRSLRP
jgi:hypothetical protein